MLFNKGFWGATIQAKYLKGLDPVTWLCNFVSAPGICSVVWRSLLKTCPIIKRSLCWEVGRGIQISVGSDPILGLGEHYTLSGALAQFLHDKGFFVLKQLQQFGDSSGAKWLMAVDLDLPLALCWEWDNFRQDLIDVGIVLTDQRDRLVWSANVGLGSVTVALAYEEMLADTADGVMPGFLSCYGMTACNSRWATSFGCARKTRFLRGRIYNSGTSMALGCVLFVRLRMSTLIIYLVRVSSSNWFGLFFVLYGSGYQCGRKFLSWTTS